MTDHVDFERLVAGHIADEGVTPPSDAFYDELFAQAARQGPRPEWLALIKEPPMRTNSHLAVGSPTVRLAAILAATMLLALALAAAGAGVQRLLAAGPIIVAQDGSGTVMTITAAVAMAEPGDEIVVKPGTYTESISIDKDITLRGESRDDVVIELGTGCEGSASANATCPAGTPVHAFWYGEGPFGILVVGGSPEISDLTITGPEGVYSTGAIVATGGGPTFRNITVAGNHPVYLEGGSTATVEGCVLSESFVFVIEPTPALVEGCDVVDIVVNTSAVPNPDGIGPIIRGNRSRGITLEAPGTIEGNQLDATIEGTWDDPTYQSGIDVISGESFIIRDNIISGYKDDYGISIGGPSTGEISGNRVTGSRGGLVLGSGETEVRGNIVTDSQAGYLLNGTVDFADNVAEGIESTAVFLAAAGQYTLSGNTACGSGVDLRIADGADVTMDDDNEFCVVEQPE